MDMKSPWNYRTNVGPTKAAIVDPDGFTVVEILNSFKSGKDFESLMAGICRDHNEAGALRAQRDELAAALRAITKGEAEFDQDNYIFACRVIERQKDIALAALAKLEKEGE